MTGPRTAAILAAVSLVACGDGTAPENAKDPAAADMRASGWSVDPGEDMNAFFNCLDEAGLALVSAHRAGPAPGYPENALETAAAILAAVPALLEVDVAASADGVLFLLHDNDLDRTTTGTGVAAQQDWADLSRLYLEDNDDQRTDFRPPRLDSFLDWAKDRTIVQIDFKRSARYEDVIETIYDQGAEDRVILIAYSMAAARKLHALAPDMMISLNLDSQSDLNRAVAAGVPDDRLLGFTGTEAPRPRLFQTLDARGVEVIFGTLGGRDSIDREIAASGAGTRYGEIAAAGADIIATDRPRAAFDALRDAGLAPGDGVCGIQFKEG